MINQYLIFRKFIGLLGHLKFPYKLRANLYDIYYRYINNKLNSEFKIAEKDLNNESTKSTNSVKPNMKKNIWVFWWQGADNMPDIVKKCVDSIQRHDTGHKVVLLTKYNIKRYTHLPNYIYEKLNQKKITLTHFSDILRFNLLHYYGGLWVDATVYCVSNLPNKCFKSLYTASGGYARDHSNVSLGKWTSFLFGGNAYQPLFVFMDNFFQLYWRLNNHLIEYFLVDYALNYAYQHNIGGFKSYVNEKVISCPNIFKMINLLNVKYDPQEYKNLILGTSFFKLTYKKRFKKGNTFYYFLLNTKNK